MSMLGLAMKQNVDKEKTTGDYKDLLLAEYKAAKAVERQNLTRKFSRTSSHKVSFGESTEVQSVLRRKTSARKKKGLKAAMRGALASKLAQELQPVGGGPSAKETGADKDRRLGFIAKIYDVDESCSSLDSGRSYSIHDSSSVGSGQRPKRGGRLDSLESADGLKKP